MSDILSGPAQVYVYDIASVMKHLEPALTTSSAEQALSVWGRDGVIDVFIEKTIHDFEIMSVWGYNPTNYPADLINLFNGQVAAVSELWRMLWLPQECSGSQVMVRRVRNTLWLVVIDPLRVRPFQKPQSPYVFH